MNIVENYLGKNKTFGYNPSYDTKKFFQEIVIPNDNYEVKLINMFNKDDIRHQDFIDFNNFLQRVEIKWGDDNKYESVNIELVNSGWFNSGTGNIIKHTYKKAGTYLVEINSVEDLVVVESSFNYEDVFNSSPVDYINLVTKRMGGMINYYIPPKSSLCNEFESRLDNIVDSLINNNDKEILNKISFVKNGSDKVYLPSSWCINVDNLETLYDEIEFKYRLDSNYSCFFTRWHSKVNVSGINDDNMYISHHISTLYNIFKKNNREYDLTGMFAHTKGFYNIISKGDISQLIYDYIYDDVDYKDDTSSYFFASLKFIMWDMKLFDKTNKYWYCFNSNLTGLDFKRTIKKYPSFLKGAFGLMENIPMYKPFSFSIFIDYIKDDNYLIGERSYNNEYNLDLSYMLFGSKNSLITTKNMEDYNIFSPESLSFNIKYDRMFSFISYSTTDIKLEDDDYSTANTRSLIPIPHINRVMGGTINNISISAKDLFYGHNGRILMDDLFINVVLENFKLSIFNNSSLIEGDYTCSSSNYSINLINGFKHFNDEFDFYIQKNDRKLPILLYSSEKINLEQKISNITINENYKSLFENPEKLVLLKLDTYSTKLFIDVDIKMIGGLTHNINYDRVFYNNCIVYNTELEKDSIVFKYIGDRFLDNINSEYLDSYKNVFDINISLNEALYNSDSDTREHLLKFGVSYNYYKLDSTLASDVVESINKRLNFTVYNGYHSPKITSAISMCDTDVENIKKQYLRIDSIDKRNKAIFRADTRKQDVHKYYGDSFWLEMDERFFNVNNFKEGANLTRMFANTIWFDIKYHLPLNNRTSLPIEKFNMTEMFAIDDEVSFREDFDNGFIYSEFMKWNEADVDLEDVCIKIGAKNGYIFDHFRIFHSDNIEFERYNILDSIAHLQINGLLKGRVILIHFIKHLLEFNGTYKEEYKYLIDGEEVDMGTYTTRILSIFPTLDLEKIDYEIIQVGLSLTRIRPGDERFFEDTLTPGYELDILNASTTSTTNPLGVSFKSGNKYYKKIGFPCMQIIDQIYFSSFSSETYKTVMKHMVDTFINNKTYKFVLEYLDNKTLESSTFSYETEEEYDDLMKYFSSAFKFEYYFENILQAFNSIFENRIYHSINKRYIQSTIYFNFDGSYSDCLTNVLVSKVDYFIKFTTEFLNKVTEVFGKGALRLFFKTIGKNISMYGPYSMLHFYVYYIRELENEDSALHNFSFSSNDLSVELTSTNVLFGFSHLFDLLYNKHVMSSDNLSKCCISTSYLYSSSTVIFRDNDLRFIAPFASYGNFFKINNYKNLFILGDGLLHHDFLLEGNNYQLMKMIPTSSSYKYPYKVFSTFFDASPSDKIDTVYFMGTLINPFSDCFYKNAIKEQSYTECSCISISNSFRIGSSSTSTKVPNLYIDPNFFSNISLVNGHLGTTTVLDITSTLNYISNITNIKFVSNTLNTNVISYLSIFDNQKTIFNNKDHSIFYNLDSLYNRDIDLYFVNLTSSGYQLSSFPLVENVYGRLFRRINFHRLIERVNNGVTQSIKANNLLFIKPYYLNENYYSKYGSFTFFNPTWTSYDSQTNYSTWEHRFTYTNYDINFDFFRNFALNPDYNTSCGYATPGITTETDNIQNEYDHYYMYSFIFNDNAKTELSEYDVVSRLYERGKTFPQIIDGFFINKKVKVEYFLNDQKVIIEELDKNVIHNLDNFNIKYNKILRSIKITVLEDENPDDFLQIHFRTAVRKNLNFMTYENFHARVFVKDNNNEVFEMMKLLFKRNGTPTEDYWHINIHKHNLTRNIPNTRVTANRTYMGEVIFTENLFNIKYRLNTNYLNNNSLTFAIPKEQEYFTLFVMNDTPFTTENSGGSVIAIESGDFGFDILSYLNKGSNNEFNLSEVLKPMCNTNYIEYADIDIFRSANSVLNTTEKFLISFGDFIIKEFNFDILNHFGENLAGIIDSFNEPDREYCTDGRIDIKLDRFEIINSFNGKLNEIGFRETYPFNKTVLKSVKDSFNFSLNSINKFVPKGIIESIIKNEFTISNSFNGNGVIITNTLRDTPINGNVIQQVNWIGCCNGSLSESIIRLYGKRAVNYLLKYKFRSFKDITKESYGEPVSLERINNEIETLKQLISNNYVDESEGITDIENSYIENRLEVIEEVEELLNNIEDVEIVE